MKHSCKRVLSLTLALMSILSLTACKREKPVESPPVVQGPVEQTQGDKFMSQGYKIKAEVKSKESLSSDPLIFEVNVDKDGDGDGLVGYRDNVYDIHMVAGEVYVVASGDLTIHLTDVNARMVLHDLDVSGVADLRQYGFVTLDDEVVSYTGSTDEVDIVSRYEVSTVAREPVSMLQSNSMTTNDLLKYFFQTISATYVDTTPGPERDPERKSFYANTDFAVTIRNVNYSIGDFCEPYTYFEEAIPQGINSKEEWREDKRVEIRYVSYISSDGMSSFMTTDGYVQAISTTSDFSFLGEIKKGMSVEELEPILGIGLKKEALAEFVPLREGLTAVKSSKVYTLTYNDYTIELEVGSNKTLESITITNYLDFRS